MKMIIDRFIKVQNCSDDEQFKVDKLMEKADELGIVVTTENCGNLNDVNNVLYVIILMIWCEFKKKFIHYVEKNNLNFTREDFCIDFNELKLGHYIVSYGNRVFELDKFVSEISEGNSEKVFKEMSEYLGLK